MLARSARALLITVSLSAATVVVFVASVLFTNAPQFWTSLFLAATSLLAMRASHTVRVRLVWWNCAAVFGLWALFDGGARLWAGGDAALIVPRAALLVRLQGSLPGQLNTEDPFLGYRHSPGAHEQDGEVVYNIDVDGLRVGPPQTPGLEHQGCVLFFGCSYTFGEGVSDDQTFPYLVQLKTGGRFQSRNFGMSGSAPHYALAQVESGMVERGAHCVPSHAIYLVLPHHLVRVAGKFLVRFGPKYVLQPSGQLVHAGSLNRTRGQFVWDLLRYTSALYVAKYGYDTAPADDGDIQLTVAVLRTLHQRLLALYPGIHFDILYWNDEPKTEIAAKLGKQLATVGAPVHEVSAVIPEIQESDMSRAYLRSDHHPSAWAHEQLAEYVIRDILATH